MPSYMVYYRDGTKKMVYLQENRVPRQRHREQYAVASESQKAYGIVRVEEALSGLEVGYNNDLSPKVDVVGRMKL